MGRTSEFFDVLAKDYRKGDLIRFTYKMQSGNYRWYEYEAVGVYLGFFGGESLRKDEFLISFRPQAGTSQFDARHLTGIERIATMEDRRGVQIRGYDERVKLPTRIKGGAVPAP